MPQRPTVSVIVPFAGSPTQLTELIDRLQVLDRGEDDEIIIADNRPGAEAESPAPGIRIYPANAVAAPGFARNRGAAAARGEWLVFLDADTAPTADLIDAYLDPAPQPSTAILAGGIEDVAAQSSPAIARHSVARAQMSQAVTLGRSDFPYAQSANVALRRDAFVAAGGFTESARAAEDADLCFRLIEAGWTIESRPGALVRHRARASFAASMGQLAIHGSGAAWCNRRHPGSFPAPTVTGFARRLGHSLLVAAGEMLRGRREAATFALLEIPEAIAFTVGRLIPNRPRWRMRP